MSEAVPPLRPAAAGDLELLLTRAALLAAGYLTWNGKVPPPELFMSLREMIGRAALNAWPWLHSCDEGDDWEEMVGDDVDEFLESLTLIVTMPSGTPN
jgi:hypothetical protein